MQCCSQLIIFLSIIVLKTTSNKSGQKGRSPPSILPAGYNSGYDTQLQILFHMLSLFPYNFVTFAVANGEFMQYDWINMHVH